MKKFAVIAAVAALAACNQSKAPEPAATPAAAETVAAAATGTQPGLYEITTADGKVARTDIKAGGTYADIVDGKEAGTGKWADKDGKLCFDGDGEGQEEQCWAMSAPGADGSMTATGATGETVTVKVVPAAGQ